MNYEALLKRAKENMPQSVAEKGRFELPKVRGHLEGNKTLVTNFPEITAKLRREPEHLQKYILKELATPGDLRGPNLILGSKISAGRINDKIKEYADEFVFCHQCGKPDTDIKKDGGQLALVCSVCGSRRQIRSKI